MNPLWTFWKKKSQNKGNWTAYCSRWFGKIGFLREFIKGPESKVCISRHVGLYGSGWVGEGLIWWFEACLTSSQKSLQKSEEQHFPRILLKEMHENIIFEFRIGWACNFGPPAQIGLGYGLSLPFLNFSEILYFLCKSDFSDFSFTRILR